VKIGKNDVVEVISGSHKGLRGRVLKVFRAKERVIVEKVNLVKKHKKPRKQGEPGGIIEMEAPIHVSNVRLIEKGTRT
jgi:large subunit ribosomal protein L24